MSIRSDKPELDQSVSVSEVGSGLRRRLVATAAEREALARRYGILEISCLEANYEITPERRGHYRLRAEVFADAVQACVITMEPVPARIEERFEVRFAADLDHAVAETEVVIEAMEEDPPEPIVDGRIAAGEMIAQHLALALDPYPRKPGVELDLDAAPGNDAESPFAILRKLS